MDGYLRRNKLRVIDLVGYTSPFGGPGSQYKEIPFEDIIFEEAGFLPAESCNVITVRVDGNIEVSFPAMQTCLLLLSLSVKWERRSFMWGIDSY